MFKEIIILLKDNFYNLKENGYISFATDAINVIYKVSLFFNIGTIIFLSFFFVFIYI